MADVRPLTGTYRLQLHADFDLADAAAVVPYLADLGVSHLYLSPVLQAAPGSMHGYDVVDHTRVSADLGGEEALVALSERAHEHGLGVVVDVVPNHMALPEPLHLNAPLWQTLMLGRESPTAHWFDVDWDLCDGRIGLPVLGDPLAETLEAGLLSIDEHEGAPVVRYYDQVFPVAPGTGEGSVAEVLDRQHYLLAGWRQKADVLGYRRFFDVDTLVAVRVELDNVFDETHALLVDLHRRGVVDGFRIDHPDGLADPEGYFARLAEATDGAWVVAEKILEGDEPLPADWAVAGTTGYDATKVVQTVFSPPTGAEIDELWRGLDGADPDLHAVEIESKALVLDDLLQPEVQRLTRRAVAASEAAGTPLETAKVDAALRALLVQTEVYRAYLRLDVPADDLARGRIAHLRELASAAEPDLTDTLDVLCDLLLDSTSTDPDTRDLVVRFGQVCGPAMAKGVEDTTFYRWHRLVALNEVGGDPLSLDDPDPRALHTWASRQLATHPHGMTTLSTHDTKRSEDARARLLAAAEDVDGWRAIWTPVREQAIRLGVDEPTAYFVLQTAVAVWPVGTDRLDGYLDKAVREAKQRTAWVDGDEDYERRVRELGALVAGDDGIGATIGHWVGDLAEGVRATTLGAKLLQLTLPGVPDVYQGCEAVELALVDPDNRRPVDYDLRRERLARLDGGQAPSDLDDEKTWVTAQALRLRRDRPRSFGSDATYRALDTGSTHAVGFVRDEAVAVVATRWAWTLRRDGWGESALELPVGRWVDLLGGATYDGGSIACQRLLASRPVALLVREDT
ncbi:malto-oligosyltrehalose synthase [Solicola sp. PLA-1-18]|uniref:malto-oligosyltrehalose synthase n=1 Tax=Solicola sp. PLA-1-18 TaxID=3380532 RepID=UPI003B77E51D